MTWGNRLRLWGGILLVLIVLAGLTLLFNQRRSSVPSLSAQVEAPRSVVSSSYGGVVTEQFVKVGDQVRKGDRLFVLNSSSLQQDVANGIRPQSNDAYDVDLNAGTLTYKANDDGYVEEMNAEKGSFMGNGTPMAQIVFDSSRNVTAQYMLTPLDYGRVEVGAQADIYLPNHKRLKGEVSQIFVETDQGRAVTKVVVVSDALMAPENAHLSRRGTPVNVQLRLRDDGILAGPTDAFLGFLTKIGLR